MNGLMVGVIEYHVSLFIDLDTSWFPIWKVKCCIEVGVIFSRSEQLRAW